MIPECRVYTSVFKLSLLLFDCIGYYKNGLQFMKNHKQLKQIFVTLLKTKSCRYLGRHPIPMVILEISEQWSREAYAIQRDQRQSTFCDLM